MKRLTGQELYQKSTMHAVVWIVGRILIMSVVMSGVSSMLRILNLILPGINVSDERTVHVVDSANSSKSDAKEGEEEVSVDLGQISVDSLLLSDAEDFLAILSDKRVTKFWDFEISNRRQAKQFIRSEKAGPFAKAIRLKDKAIGYISVTEYSGWRAKSAAISYFLGHKYWNKGITTHAVKLVLKTIFSRMPDLERLEGLVEVENIGSQRVLENAGFQREGVLRNFAYFRGECRDMVMFGFLRTDLRS